MIKKTPTRMSIDELLLDEPAHLKTCRLDKSDIQAMEQGLVAIDFLVELLKGRGEIDKANTLACHAYNLGKLLEDVEDIPATLNDMGYN